MELHDLGLVQAARSIRQGDVSAEAYARSLLDRCETAEWLNAFILLDGERVLEEAQEADRLRRDGHSLGPLHGVPIAVKDSFDVAGLPTTAGTPALRGNVVRRTAPMIRRLFEAGALMLGKTNMHEMAFGITSSNAWAGAVRNPYDATASAGGSSSGTAAAVAARLTPAGVGSDTSGSIRVPASHCGIVGYRPSTGRYSGEGLFPLFHTRDTPGFMARSVGDIALLDEVVSGDGTLSEVELRGLRIGHPGDYFFTGLDSRVAAAIDAELRRLRALGVVLVEADPPDFAAAIAETTGAIKDWEMPRDVARYLAEVGLDIGFEALVAPVASPHVKAELEGVLEGARAPDLKDRYERAVSEVLPRLQAEYLAYLKDNDLEAIAFPTSPLAPTPLGEDETVTVDGEEVSVWRSLRNSVPASLLRAPALSLPVGLTSDGLPVGLELDGAPDADRELLSIGIAWEYAWPKIAAPDL
jgi:mandelamide amidase